MFRNNFLIDLGEPDYCKRSIDSMTFHTLLDAHQQMSLIACYYICGSIPLVPSYFLKPNKFFILWKSRTTRFRNDFKNHHRSFISIITFISFDWIAIYSHSWPRACAELQHGWFSSIPTKQKTLEKSYMRNEMSYWMPQNRIHLTVHSVAYNMWKRFHLSG
jgi:hypothetical protein